MDSSYIAKDSYVQFSLNQIPFCIWKSISYSIKISRPFNICASDPFCAPLIFAHPKFSRFRIIYQDFALSIFFFKFKTFLRVKWESSSRDIPSKTSKNTINALLPVEIHGEYDPFYLSAWPPQREASATGHNYMGTTKTFLTKIYHDITLKTACLS